MDNHMFDAYAKEVEVDTAAGGKVKVKMRPLSGRFLPKLFTIIGKIEKVDDKEDGSEEEKKKKFSETLDALGEDGILSLHELILETLKKSYPDQTNPDTLDEFVSQNLFQLFPALMEVNINSGKRTA